MKTFLSFVVLSVCLLTNAQAALLGAPFIPEVDARFNALEGGNVITQSYPIGSADGHNTQQLAQATYDFSKQSGAIGTYDLGVSLPANAIITQTYLYSITQPTTSASGTLAFYCQNSGDVIGATAAASYASAGAAISGASTGIAANFKFTTAKCDLHAVIATGALTAGKVTAFIEYVVHK